MSASQYTSAAGAAVFFYDILITLDLEVEHIWSRLSFDAITVAYLTSRYLSLGFFFVTVYTIAGFYDELSDTFCKIPFDCIGYTISYIAWTGMMTLRVSALWAHERWLVRLIRTLWICVTCITIVVTTLAYNEVRGSLYYDPSLRLCICSINPQIFKAVPITPAIYELFLTILTITKVLDYSSLSSPPMLYHVLARDGVFYFIASIVTLSISVVTWYVMDPSQTYLLLSLNWAIVSVVMSRMVLHLRATHYRSTVEQTGTGGVGPTIKFQSHSHTGLKGHGTLLSNGERGLDPSERDLQLDANGEAWRLRPFRPSQSVAPPDDASNLRKHSVTHRPLSPV